jgi:hypothetical protein
MHLLKIVFLLLTKSSALDHLSLPPPKCRIPQKTIQRRTGEILCGNASHYSKSYKSQETALLVSTSLTRHEIGHDNDLSSAQTKFGYSVTIFGYITSSPKFRQNRSYHGNRMYRIQEQDILSNKKAASYWGDDRSRDNQ